MSRIKEKRELMERIGMARSELERLRLSLSEAYNCFNAASDPEIVEACILEISALQSRYSAALRNIKTMDGDKIKWRSR